MNLELFLWLLAWCVAVLATLMSVCRTFGFLTYDTEAKLRDEYMGVKRRFRVGRYTMAALLSWLWIYANWGQH